MIEVLRTFFTKQIFRLVHFDLHDYRKTIFLAGSARSGTTWLQEIVNYNNEFRVLFEPFRPDKVEMISHWRKYQYLQADKTSSLYLDPMRDILSGKIKNIWVDTYNQRIFSGGAKNKKLIRFLPALNITTADIDLFFDALEKELNALVL